MALRLNLGTLVVNIRMNSIGFEKTLRTVQASMNAAAANMQAAGIKMAMAMTAPIGLVGIAAVKEFSKFEDAVIEIQKVTDKFTADKLARSMEELSLVVPVAAADLALLAGDAARFGVSGVKNIEKFTETVAKMAIATDLTTEQAGEAFAKLSAIAGLPISDVEKLGSSINTLSNTYATSAKEIVDAMLRSAGPMKQFGIAVPDMAALAAIMNEAGFSAMRSGTQIKSLMASLSTPQTVTRMSKELGVTVTQFRNMTKTAPVKTLLNLARLMANGTRQAFDLGKTMSQETFVALQKIGAQADKVEKAMALANKSFKEGTSLQKEFNATSKTFSAQMQLMWNFVTKAGRAIGRILAPMILRANQVIITASKWWNNLSEGLRKVIVQFALILAAIGPVLFLIGKMIALGGFLAGMMATFISVGGAILGAVVSMLSFGAAIVAVATGPIGLLIAAIAGIGFMIATHTAAGQAAIKNLVATFEWWGQVVDDLMARMKVSFASISTAIADGNIAGAVRVLWAQINLEWAKGMDTIAKSWGPVIDQTKEMWKTIKLGTVFALDVLGKTFLDTLSVVVTVLGEVVNAAAEAAVILARSTGSKSLIRGSIAAKGAAVRATMLTQSEINLARKKSADFFLKQQVATQGDRFRGAGALNTADQAALQLKQAQKAWADSMSSVEKTAAANRKKIDEPIKVVAEAVNGAKSTGENPFLNQGAAASSKFFQAGAFLANQLQGVGDASEKKEEKEIQKKQLNELQGIQKEVKKTAKAGANQGNVVVLR